MESSSLGKVQGGDNFNTELLQQVKTPSLGKMGQRSNALFEVNVSNKYNVGMLISQSLLSGKAQLSSTNRESQLRPKVFEKFKNMSKEKQRAILGKMKHIMNA